MTAMEAMTPEQAASTTGLRPRGAPRLARRGRLSACLIVKDEAALLPRALASLAGRVDEIVVVDTGSSDGTQALCRAVPGLVLVEEPWQGSFSLARNRALGAATSRHCLMIDADEEIDGATWPALLSFLAEGRCDLGRVWQVSDTEDGVVRESITRLCPNDGRFHYEGRVHEQLVPVSAQGPLPPSRGDTGLVLLHSGYQKEALRRKGTAARNLALLQAELLERPRDPYVHYQLGRTLWQERPADAVRHFERALGLVSADAAYLPSLVRELGYALRAARREREALALTRAYGARLPRFTDLVFLEGLLHMDLGDAAAMVRSFERCLELGEGDGDGTTAFSSLVEGVGSYRPHHNLGLFYELSGQPERAQHHYRQALLSRPGFAPARERLDGLSGTALSSSDSPREAGRPSTVPTAPALDSTEGRRGP